MNTTTTVESPDARRQHIGRIFGPILALGVYWLTPSSLPEAARWTAASGVLMGVFWVTEAIPLAATALLPLVLFPILGVVEIHEAATPFAQPVIFLFLGGFLIASAVERCGLHRRIALTVVRSVGGTSGQILAGCMAATAILSMWISNTAATMMMLPIAISLTSMLNHDDFDPATPGVRGRFDVCFLLGVAYSANIGGLGTIVGTPPNALLAGFLQQQGVTLGFGRWMLFAVPLVMLFLGVCWALLYRFALDKSCRAAVVSAAALDAQYRDLGPMTRAQRTVLAVFLSTVALWIIREPMSHWEWLVGCCPWIARLDDASIAIGAAVALFLLPGNKGTGERALDWNTASGVSWGVLVLIGGGMSLGSAMTATGLTRVMGDQLQIILSLPTLLLILVLTGAVIFLTEIVSNTAITAAILPVMFGLGAQSSGGPLSLLVPATLAASCAFMLPIGTPPNAVVYGTGQIPMHTMVRYGLWLNLFGTLLITGLMYLLGWILLR